MRLASAHPAGGTLAHHVRGAIEDALVALGRRDAYLLAKQAVEHLRRVRRRRVGAWEAGEIASLVRASMCIGALSRSGRESAVYRLLVEALARRAEPKKGRKRGKNEAFAASESA